MRNLLGLLAGVWLAVVSAADVGVVLVGRSDVTTAAYSGLVSGLQTSASAAGVTLHVNTLVSATDASIDQSVQDLKNKGYPVFVVGHSMTGGGVAAQNYVAANPGKVKGLALVAGFLQRKFRPDVKTCLAKASIKPAKSLSCPLGCLAEGSHDCYGNNVASFPVPTLSIGGELDGVVRIARFAEAQYTQKSLSSTDFPVVIIPGLNHATLLSTTTLPAAVSKADLKAEVAGSAGVSAVADALTHFITAHAALSEESSSALLKLSESSGELLSPLISALVGQEGSWFLTGGDDEHGSSGWGGRAQQLMVGTLPGAYSWSTGNEFRLLCDEDKIPPYFRPKHRPDIKIVGSSISTRTVTQLRYIKLSTTDTAMGLNAEAILREEKLGLLGSQPDDGSQPVSAIELGTKLASRQLVFNMTGNASPETLDDGNRCGDINQAAYDWALNAVGSAAASRFRTHGVPLRMQADKKPAIPAGPWWIWTYLDISLARDLTAADVTSYYAFFNLDADPYGAGNHYCKLLSPAYAMEWILTDGLRPKYGL